MQLQVINFRPYSKGALVGFFDVVLDNVFVVRGFTLKSKSDGSGHYWQAPSKPRIKNGEHLKDDKGFAIYDAHFDLYGETDSEGKYSPTKDAFQARKDLIELAVKAWQVSAQASNGRGSTAAKPTKPAGVATGVEGGDALDSEDDDLPF